MKRSYASASAAWSPALSPDGARIAYCSDRDGAPRVWLHDRRRGTDTHLPGAPESVQRVSWSIDGDWLALLVAPQGALYAFPGVDTGRLPGFDDATFALDLLEHEQIILVPGSSFNIAARNHFRLTLLPEPAMLADALARIERQLERTAERTDAKRRVA